MKLTTFQQYLLDSIDFEGTNEQKIEFLYNSFNEEYNYSQNRRLIPNLQNRFESYLRGLPTNIAFDDCEIEECRLKFGFANVDQDTFCETWFTRCAVKYLHMFPKFGLSVANLS